MSDDSVSEFQQLMRDATRRGDTNELKLLMKRGDKIDPDELLSLLKLATRKFDEEVALVLLDADHVRFDEEVKSALAGLGTRTFQFLLDYDIDLPDFDDDWFAIDSPFHYVARNLTKDPVEIVKMLVKHGVAMSSLGWKNSSCYLEAVEYENYIALYRFLECGPMMVLPDEVDSIFCTAFASELEFKEKAISLLLSALIQPPYPIDVGELTNYVYPLEERKIWIDLIFSGCDMDWANYTQLEILGSEVTEIEIEQSKRRLQTTRIGLIRRRALEVCIALQTLRIDALQMCEILTYSCDPIASLIPFHILWNIATTVKHFRK